MRKTKCRLGLRRGVRGFAKHLELGFDFVDFPLVVFDCLGCLLANGLRTLAGDALHVLFCGSDSLLEA